MHLLRVLLVTLPLLAASSLHAQLLNMEPGIYKGSIVVTRSNVAFGIKDTCTFLISGQLNSSLSVTGFPMVSYIFTPRNLEPSVKLQNPVGSLILTPAVLDSSVFPVTLDPSSINIPFGTVVRSSVKGTARSLFFKCETRKYVTQGRNMNFVTTFSIARTGPIPAND